MNFNKANITRGLVIALAGNCILWVGGFLWLINGSEWEAMESAIKNDSSVNIDAKNIITKVEPEFLGYGYGFTENGGYANFKVEVKYLKGAMRYKIRLKKLGQTWKVVLAERL